MTEHKTIYYNESETGKNGYDEIEWAEEYYDLKTEKELIRIMKFLPHSLHENDDFPYRMFMLTKELEDEAKEKLKGYNRLRINRHKMFQSNDLGQCMELIHDLLKER